MDDMADVLVIGSGAAGTSASFPIVEAGISVLMLDQGRTRPQEHKSDDDMSSLWSKRTNDPAQWELFLGRDLSGNLNQTDVSPKFRIPSFRYITEGFAEAYNIEADGVFPTGSLSLGGLTGMWGGGAVGYNDIDLSDYGLQYRDFAESYKRVALRIGVSGKQENIAADEHDWNDVLLPPLPLNSSFEDLYDKAQRSRKRSSEFELTRATNAVLSTSSGSRHACNLSNRCLWGCAQRAIYSAEYDVEKLKQYRNFRHVSGAFVYDIESHSEGFSVHCRDLENLRPDRVFRAKTVILAAGTIGSTILAARLNDHKNIDIPLHVHPAFAMAFCNPKYFGHAAAESGFGLAQLFYAIKDADLPERCDAFGALFSAEGIPASELVDLIPLSRPGAVSLARLLIPSLILANCYLPSRFARCFVRIENRSEAEKVVIHGNRTSQFKNEKSKIVRSIKRNFRTLGLLPLPFSVRNAKLGSDGHYVGGVPMRRNPDVMETNFSGELTKYKNLFVVDGAALPSLPAKHPTFTIMANADRIGVKIRDRLTRNND